MHKSDTRAFVEIKLVFVNFLGSEINFLPNLSNWGGWLNSWTGSQIELLYFTSIVDLNKLFIHSSNDSWPRLEIRRTQTVEVFFESKLFGLNEWGGGVWVSIVCIPVVIQDANRGNRQLIGPWFDIVGVWFYLVAGLNIGSVRCSGYCISNIVILVDNFHLFKLITLIVDIISLLGDVGHNRLHIFYQISNSTSFSYIHFLLLQISPLLQVGN